MPVRTRVRASERLEVVGITAGRLARQQRALTQSVPQPRDRPRRVYPHYLPETPPCCAPCSPFSSPWPPLLACAVRSQARPLVELAVVDRDTRRHGWIRSGTAASAGSPATPGHRYSVRLTNTTGGRVLVVLSVDGVNAVTGQTAHPSQTGYVLGPWQSTEINGWRKSLDDVAQFVFTDLPDSYAARTGRPDNVGVIGVAVFEEARRWYDEYPDPIARGPGAREPRDAMAARAASATTRQGGRARSRRVAIGRSRRMARSRWAPVTARANGRQPRAPVSYAPRALPRRSANCVTTIIDALVARGVLRPYPPYRWRDRPHAFPEGFVADPPG